MKHPHDLQPVRQNPLRRLRALASTSAFASVAALAVATPAFAQSSVTVYGIVDLDGEYLSGHAKDIRVTSGGLSGSRLGFKGTEDLGGGNQVEFVLEGGLNVDEGGSAQGGALFGRQAFGALRTPSGTFSAGRQYSSLYVMTSEFSAFSNNPVGPTTAVIGGFAGGYEPVRGGSATAVPPASGAGANGGPARVNNSLRYTSPSLGGVKASVLYGAGEVAGQTARTRLVDGSLRFTQGPLDAMVSRVDDRAAGASAATSTHVATTTIAANMGVGAFHIEGGYMDVNDRRPANLDGKGYWLGGDYRFGAQLLRAQWVRSAPEHTTAAKTDAYGVGYQYDFSKRTSLYSSLTRFANGGSGLGRFATAIPGGLTQAGDSSLSEFALGVRHLF